MSPPKSDLGSKRSACWAGLICCSWWLIRQEIPFPLIIAPFMTLAVPRLTKDPTSL